MLCFPSPSLVAVSLATISIALPSWPSFSSPSLPRCRFGIPPSLTAVFPRLPSRTEISLSRLCSHAISVTDLGCFILALKGFLNGQLLYFKENADYNNLAYNTKYEVYSKGCGLNNVMMSWGHDDSMYLVAKENKTTLPSAALFIIRYHSFYPLHRSGVYKNLINKEDVENLKWLQAFK
ncbi:hypothetical protein JRO89_XS02G0090300 [Xanthoceras sorbifolium]|uniref:Inositol oxygenase n=1 Tax=Xanthoceras sorbifolium TaxID=99658 RepID=A0ABQ8IF99_9ROSI|nr:hypothetical protein JRO89_XS02G0090300 [Xanthoceras sorbifolium]